MTVYIIMIMVSGKLLNKDFNYEIHMPCPASNPSISHVHISKGCPCHYLCDFFPLFKPRGHVLVNCLNGAIYDNSPFPNGQKPDPVRSVYPRFKKVRPQERYEYPEYSNHNPTGEEI